jgi:hypothetical protein
MAKMTKKYSAAINVALKKNIPPTPKQDDMYAALEAVGIIWDSSQGAWNDTSNVPAEPASEVLRVRVWAKTEDVETQAGQVMQALISSGYVFLERSRPYVCRPPKQLESRVYLSFMKVRGA